MADVSVADLMDAARDQDPTADWIVIHHPDIDGVAVVTRESFEQDSGHAEKGWIEGEPGAKPKATAAAHAHRSPEPKEA